jgi:hypothetical protein
MPVEIQLAICDQLLQRRDTTGMVLQAGLSICRTFENLHILGNLALTCKHFQQVTTPIVYQRARVSIHRPAAIIRFCKHFSRFPGHAGLVKELTIGSGWDGSQQLRAGVLDFFLHEATRLSLKRPPDGGIQLESVMIGVVLCQVPGIRKLVLSIPGFVAAADEVYPSPKFYSGDTVLSYADWLPDSFVLGSLRRLEARPPRFMSNPSAKLQQPLLTAFLRCAPALTHLRVGPCTRVAPGIIQDPLPQLRDISLTHASASDIAGIARFCPRLETFRFGHRNVMLSPGPIEMLQNKVARNLSPGILVSLHSNAGSGLCNLHLLPLGDAFGDLGRSYTPDLDLIHRLYVLHRGKQFTLAFRLESLELLCSVLEESPAVDNAMLIDRLWLNLELLCVSGYYSQVYELAVLLSQRIRDGGLPKLRWFRYSPARAEQDAGMVEKIASVFEGSCVDCAEMPTS